MGNEEEWWVSHYDTVFKLNWISILNRMFDWSAHFRSTGTFRGGGGGGGGLNLLTTVKPVWLGGVSVNKSRDTRNCVPNEPDYAICVISTIH